MNVVYIVSTDDSNFYDSVVMTMFKQANDNIECDRLRDDNMYLNILIFLCIHVYD